MGNQLRNQEEFIDNKHLRVKHIGKIEVLDKVKKLILLPNSDLMTMKMLIEFYEVEEGTIKMLVHRHKDELALDGLKNLTGNELSNIKLLCDMKSNKARGMMVFTKRSCLRVGMLLRDSEIAIEVRTKLLDVEESDNQQRTKATKGSEWDSLDLILYDIIITEIENGGSLTSACKIASKQLNKTQAQCMSRYSQNIKKRIQNENLVNKIQNNKGRPRLSLVKNDPTKPSEEEIRTSLCRPATHEELFYNAVICMIEDLGKDIKISNDLNLHLLNEKNSEIEKMKSDYSVIHRKYNKISDELKQVHAVIGSAVKVSVNETLNQTFSMDRNGNLQRK